MEDVLALLAELGIGAKILDERSLGNHLDVKFRGTLTTEQQDAAGPPDCPRSWGLGRFHSIRQDRSGLCGVSI